MGPVTAGEPVNTRHLHRPALLARLDRALDHPLTVLSAPAGTGKTVLLTQWAERCPVPLTWIEPGDILPSDDAALAGAPAHVIVVDDRRAAEADRRYARLASAIAEAPGCGLRLVVALRGAPPPELAALVLRDVAWQLTDADLRVGPEEAAALVEAVTGRPVEPDLAAAVAEHHDGWMAGIALTARSWPAAARPTLDQVVASSAALIDDLVLTEVLAPLPDPLRSFVLRTAVLPELSSELCDAVLETTDSGTRLQQLRREGAILEPSDRAPGWWRYPRRVRRALSRTSTTDGEEHRGLLRRAAAAYADAGLVPQAVDCLVELKDWDRLRDLITAEAPGLFTDNRFGDLQELLGKVPAHVYRQQLPWVLARATANMVHGQIAAGMDLLGSVQLLLEPGDAMRADNVRSIAVGWAEDTTPFITLAESGLAACDALGDDHDYDELHPARTDHYRVLFRHSGRLAGALAGEWARVERLDGPITPESRLGMPPAVLAGVYSQRAAFHVLAGDARAALAAATTSLEIGTELGLVDHPLLGEAHVVLGEALRIAGRSDEAGPVLERGLRLSSEIRRRNGIAMAVAGLAQLDVDAGRPDDAIARIADHRRGPDRGWPTTIAANLAAAESRALAAIGQLHAALDGLGRAPRTAVTAATHVALLLEQRDRKTARRMLDEWPAEPTPGARLRRELAEVALLDATAHRAEADDRLVRTLDLAEATDQIQPYAELADALTAVLRRAGNRRSSRRTGAFLGRILQAGLLAGAPADLPLTVQEVVVLRHLAHDQTLATVAEVMDLSINTIKTHVRAIYRKLGVNGRADAVRIWGEQTGG